MSEKFFLVPTKELGRVEDVFPERLRAADNSWIAHTREILRKKQQAVRAGGYRPQNYVGEYHEKVKPATADHCPAMEEISSVGWLLKWPATAILRRVAPKGWLLKPSANYDFYAYSPLTAFPEIGEAEAILVETGWTVITPPGWSVLIKNVPNHLTGPIGLSLAEGIVRTDMATLPLQTHAMLRADAPAEIHIKRGTPMAAIFPFRREEIDAGIVDDVSIVDEVAARAAAERSAFEDGAGVYRTLYMGKEPRPSELYEKLKAKS